MTPTVFSTNPRRHEIALTDRARAEISLVGGQLQQDFAPDRGPLRAVQRGHAMLRRTRLRLGVGQRQHRQGAQRRLLRPR